MWHAATAVAERRWSRSATGVVRVAAISLRIWSFRDRSKHPAVAAASPPYPRRSAEFLRQKLAYAKGRLKVLIRTSTAPFAPGNSVASRTISLIQSLL